MKSWCHRFWWPLSGMLKVPKITSLQYLCNISRKMCLLIKLCHGNNPFHLLYSHYRGVKIFFTRVFIKIKIFPFCRTRFVRVALVSHSRRTCVAVVSEWECRVRLTPRVLSCYKRLKKSFYEILNDSTPLSLFIRL